jgi:hypothetical protein
MGTLWNVDNTGNLTVGSIGTRSITQIQQNVLPVVFTNSSSITATLNTQYIIQSGSGWTLNLPTTSTIGDRIIVTTTFAGGTIQLASLNYVVVGNRSTTLGGTLSCSDEGATICLVHDQNFGGQREWIVDYVIGSWIGSGSPTNFGINGQFNFLRDNANNALLNYQSRQLIGPNGSQVQVDFSAANVIDQSIHGANSTKIGFLSLFNGSNGCCGVGTLTGGTVSIPVTGASASSIVFLTNQFAGGSSNAGQLFGVTTTNLLTVTSSVGADSGPFYYVVINTHT